MSLLKNLSTVSKWATTYIAGEEPASLLELAFEYASDTLFSNIYLPIKTPTSEGMPENYTYTNIGLGADDIADVFCTMYGKNYIVDALDDTNDTTKQASLVSLSTKIDPIFVFNEAKYKKLIELQGYTYNPLWNVDGVETTVHEYGEHETEVTNGERTLTDTIGARTLTDRIAQYTIEDDMKSKTNDTREYGTTMDDTINEKLKTHINEAEGAHKDVHTHGAHNDSHENSQAIDTHVNDEVTDTTTSHEHTDTITYTRTGNIGVTKTQELIEAERKNLMFNIIGEFFRDIYPYVIVGVFDYKF